ncbi:hypothetical protein Desti_0235 [Desulfomonile tiedjei DSM 6799]|uniref:Uncharacterized protein n=1 Tax=Desulfomonile tiedjei (strain ATCC 49306 / DSM 6799 / DCB-1) TaxID=706587 RepID=I4C090_DESTA|nr:hypothetical protein Desti_0235 [Desulfomonile tiedjei DSM 6799]
MVTATLTLVIASDVAMTAFDGLLNGHPDTLCEHMLTSVSVPNVWQLRYRLEHIDLGSIF